ncbi:hypothetical protein [Streptomyces sp. AC495_CC817]|uniref:hypothetical protein n=1 Tax=Streptomyces sp. AC495_CC817 TaxID=2823900 RepID=UPI001C2756AE|nr:hypothetical protein [Streptomyces sp. AC495_CC817]
MAVTPNFSIPLYGDSDPAKLSTLLNGQATALDTNLKAALNAATIGYIGPDSGRTALTTPALREGVTWYSDDTNVAWFYDGSAWRIDTSAVVHLTSGVITAQSSFAIDSLTGFSEYEITLDLPTSSTANEINAQLRAAGVANSSANYDRQILVGAATTATASSALASTSWTLTGGGRADKNIVLRLANLNASGRTHATVITGAWDATANPMTLSMSLRHRSGTAFNGVGFTTSTGTVTGTYTVRGIR